MWRWSYIVLITDCGSCCSLKMCQAGDLLVEKNKVLSCKYVVGFSFEESGYFIVASPSLPVYARGSGVTLCGYAMGRASSMKSLSFPSIVTRINRAFWGDWEESSASTIVSTAASSSRTLTYHLPLTINQPKLSRCTGQNQSGQKCELHLWKARPSKNSSQMGIRRVPEHWDGPANSFGGEIPKGAGREEVRNYGAHQTVVRLGRCGWWSKWIGACVFAARGSVFPRFYPWFYATCAPVILTRLDLGTSRPWTQFGLDLRWRFC